MIQESQMNTLPQSHTDQPAIRNRTFFKTTTTTTKNKTKKKYETQILNRLHGWAGCHVASTAGWDAESFLQLHGGSILNVLEGWRLTLKFPVGTIVDLFVVFLCSDWISKLNPFFVSSLYLWLFFFSLWRSLTDHMLVIWSRVRRTTRFCASLLYTVDILLNVLGRLHCCSSSSSVRRWYMYAAFLFLLRKNTFIVLIPLTFVLLNPDIPCLCKQCRSRSVGFWRSQLIWICTVCH